MGEKRIDAIGRGRDGAGRVGRGGGKPWDSNCLPVFLPLLILYPLTPPCILLRRCGWRAAVSSQLGLLMLRLAMPLHFNRFFYWRQKLAASQNQRFLPSTSPTCVLARLSGTGSRRHTSVLRNHGRSGKHPHTQVHILHWQFLHHSSFALLLLA